MDIPTSVTGLHADAPQLTALDQCRRNRDELFGENYAPTLALLVAHGDFRAKAWRESVDPLIEQLTNGWARRTLASGAEQRETKSIAATVATAQRWLREARLAVRLRARTGEPAAIDLLDEVSAVADAEDTYRQTDVNVYAMIGLLARVADLTVVGLSASFLQTGRDLLASLRQDRFEQTDAQSGIERGADELDDALLALANEMEILHDARELASLRTGKELQGFDLRYIRAAVAGRRKRTTPSDGGTSGATGGATGL